MIRRRPRGEPVHPTRAEIRSGWRFLAALPGRGWRLVAHLWRSSRATTLLVLVATGAVALTLALLGTGGDEIWEIICTLGLAALVLAVSEDHRTMGAVVVVVLGLSLIGTLAGPRWRPEPVPNPLLPASTSTAIGGNAVTVPVGTYQVETTTVTITQADGEQLPALLRRPLGIKTGTPGVVFFHGAGTQSIDGFAEQAQALASAGATTIVPSKPMEDYSLTERDYISMANDYRASVDYLRSLPGVDPGHVGLYAESEGAIPGVILAAEDPQVAFLVLASAPIVSLREQAAFAADSYLRDVGVPEPLMRIIPRVLGASQVPGGFEYADVDPAAYEQRLTQPILMLYGTADRSMPVVQGPLRVWDSIQVNGNHQLTVRYYADANHGLKLGGDTDGPLAPGVARDLARWVTGLPATADAAPRVAGATPTQEHRASRPGATRWYASGDLMLAGIVAGLGLVAAAGAGWGLGQLPRLGGRAGLRLPAPIGRWTVSLCLSVLGTWALYLVYIGAVIRLALDQETNAWISYGGWLAAQVSALLTLVILVKVVQRAWRMCRTRRTTGGPRFLTRPAAGVLASALIGTIVLLLELAYWGLFPMLY